MVRLLKFSYIFQKVFCKILTQSHVKPHIYHTNYNYHPPWGVIPQGYLFFKEKTKNEKKLSHQRNYRIHGIH